ncbi:MAG TPA: PAS domain-containing protein [Xanthobacteraceae bacterium]|nr:PAS domain-containing protein [Xanthobacteraceae bacterium]
MRYFLHIDTGMGRIEDHSGSDFPDLRTATKVAIEKARDFLLKHSGRNPLLGYELFVEISHESGDLLALLTPPKLLFGEPITDRHCHLCDVIPHPWLRLNRDLAIQDANTRYLSATFTDRDLISGRSMFEVFPDNPNDLKADGVKNLSTSLREVLRTRQPNRMALQRYDVRGRSGRWFHRRWKPINVPVLDHNGEIDAVIHHVEHISGESAPTLS